MKVESWQGCFFAEARLGGELEGMVPLAFWQDHLGEHFPGRALSEEQLVRARESCLGKFLLGCVVREVTGEFPVLSRSGRGAPLASQGGVSYAHSAGRVFAAFCPSGSVGIDGQKVRAVGPRMWEKVLSESERAQSCFDELLFFAYWGAKEAMGKAQGVGLSAGMHKPQLFWGKEQQKIFCKGRMLLRHGGSFLGALFFFG